MVHAALQNRSATLGRSPHPAVRIIPAGSVVAGSLLALLPIVSQAGWMPDAGFLMLIAWRLLRSDAWPAWWAAPLGFANDLIAGTPIGQSVAFWSAVMLLLDLADRRTMWRDYWLEWGLAGLLILANEWFSWRISGWSGARVPFSAMWPSVLVSLVAFPLAAGIVGLLDRWRLGR